MPVKREDPYAGYNFLVEINGLDADPTSVHGSFQEVSGIGVEVTPIEYRNGSEDITVRKVPGLKKFTNITLKRGMTGDVAFWDWIVSAMKGEVQKSSGSIILLDEKREEVMRFNFFEAWPTKWTGPSLKADGNEIAIEMIEICHEGLEIAK